MQFSDDMMKVIIHAPINLHNHAVYDATKVKRYKVHKFEFGISNSMYDLYNIC